MTEVLAGRKPGKVLEIGTGCGYQTAVLLKTGAEVYSIERLSACWTKQDAICVQPNWFTPGWCMVMVISAYQKRHRSKVSS
jgi:16S rRNA A1518/A1519 N6-dimethyltransferase RsmA/KsgA/DIM1 with predicted DNA glycosylase/AP lyase activity